MLKRMKIGVRLMAGFGIVLFVLVALGLTGFLGIRNLTFSIGNILDVDATLAEESSMTLVEMLQLRRFEKDAFINMDIPETRANYNRKWEEKLAGLQQRLGQISGLLERMGRRDDVEFINTWGKALTTYVDGYREVYDGIRKGTIKSTRQANEHLQKFKGAIHDLEKMTQEFDEKNSKSLDDRKLQLLAAGRTISWAMISACLVALGLGIGVSTLITRSIRGPLDLITKRLVDISEGEGDLTVEIAHDSSDEIGILAASFNRFVAKIRLVVKDVMEASHQLAASSGEMTTTSSGLSMNAQNQAASAEEITATIEEVSAAVDGVAANAEQQFQRLSSLITRVQEMSGTIHEMQKTVAETVKMSEHISLEAKSGDESIKMMTGSMSRISESSEKMTGIIGIINGISDQINLLSLNAAIEAARAGEAGRGFAVVADEISKLADATTGSLKEIDSLVKINNNETAMGIGNVDKAAETIVKIIGGVGSITKMMDTIFASIENQVRISGDVDQEVGKVMGMSNEIRVATEEQKTAFNEIVKSVSTINELSQSNASVSEEMTGVSEGIAGMADTLNTRVLSFKV